MACLRKSSRKTYSRKEYLKVIRLLRRSEDLRDVDALFGSLPTDCEDFDWFIKLAWNRSMQKKTEIFPPSGKLSSKNYSFLSHFLLVLTHCLLCQRWPVCLQLSAMAANIVTLWRPWIRLWRSLAYWKLPLELLYKDPAENSSLIGNHMRMLTQVAGVDQKQVFQEYVVYLISQHSFTELKDFTSLVKVGWSKQKDRYHGYMDTIFYGYKGLVQYIYWWLQYQQEVQEQGEEVLRLAIHQGTQGHEGNLESSHWYLVQLAEKACKLFERMYEEDMDVVDTFITKHVKVLEFLGREEEAGEVLSFYRQKCPRNPNTHRYLIDFCSRHDMSWKSESRLDMQKKLLKLLPDDQLALDISKQLIQDGNFTEGLDHLFQLLDFPHWQDIMEPWELLSNTLQALLRNRDVNMVNPYWEPRQSWWPLFQFRLIGNVVVDTSLLFHKTVCSSILQAKALKKDGWCAFTEKQLEVLKNIEDMIMMDTYD